VLRSPPASATFAAGDNVEISGGGVRWRTVWRWPAGGEFTVTVGAQLSDCGAHPQIAVGSLHNVGHQTVRQSAVHVPGIHLVISLDLGAAERSVGGPPAPRATVRLHRNHLSRKCVAGVSFHRNRRSRRHEEYGFATVNQIKLRLPACMFKISQSVLGSVAILSLASDAPAIPYSRDGLGWTE